MMIETVAIYQREKAEQANPMALTIRHRTFGVVFMAWRVTLKLSERLVRFVFFPEALHGRACLLLLSRETFGEWNDHCLHNRLNTSRDATPLHD